MRFLILLCILIQGMYSIQGQSTDSLAQELWVTDLLDSMSLDEKIGQLFMIRAHSDKGSEHIKEVKYLIEKYHVGSLCFFQGTPEKQAELTNQYQSISRIPLLVAIDAEWGLGMRFKEDAISFPRQLSLGAIKNNALLYEMGKEIGWQLKRIGTHVNFAPVIDINNNPDNPVINDRSFGEDRYNVTAKGYMYMLGMQDAGIMACAKHFPGHGDTDVDSHYDLPLINHSKARLDSLELFPFSMLSQQGLQSIMIAHLNVPALEPKPNTPSTLSKSIVKDLLQGEMGFKGLVFSDALEMKGVQKYHNKGILEAEAIVAGNDILCLPEDLSLSLKYIKQYIKEGKISLNDIDEKVKKILRAKYKLALHLYRETPVQNIRKEVNNNKALALKSKLVENALTLVRNKDAHIPFKEIDTREIATLAIGSSDYTPFQKRLTAYGVNHSYYHKKGISAVDQSELIKKLKGFDNVIVSFHNMSKYASRGFGISKDDLSFLKKLQEETRVIIVLFGNPYALKYFDDFDWVLQAYEEDDLNQDLSAQGLFGVFGFKGRLPITASKKSAFNTGISTPTLMRTGFALPEQVGLNSDSLAKIDTIIEKMINSGAAPGCQVLVSKNGKIVFEKSYGYHTYNKRQKVENDHLYDLASVTKILASTIAVMHLLDKGQISIYDPISKHIPGLDTSNKKNMMIRDVMAHHAGLISWIPFYLETISEDKYDPKPLSDYYRKELMHPYNVKVSEDLYITESYIDSIWAKIIMSDLRPNKNYRYSDLGFYLIAELVKIKSGLSIDQYMNKHFYHPMGLQKTMFNPADKVKLEQIPPTEEDNYFRKTKIHGYVHDMGAAMMGGISGHAGLFSNAREVSFLMQMLLNGGYYGGRQYLQSSTIHLFTMRHPKSSRRGIGFDMKELNTGRNLNMAFKADPSTFGHLGFTGTAVWADPENQLIFVFLSNRTYPSMNNNKLNKENFRPRIQNMVYRSIMN